MSSVFRARARYVIALLAAALAAPVAFCGADDGPREWARLMFAPVQEERLKARKALIRDASLESVRAVVELSRDPAWHNPMVRVIAEMGPRAIPHLLDLLQDENLRGAAGQALFKAIGADSAELAGDLLTCVKWRPASKSYCGMALVRAMGPKAKGQVPLLRETLKSEDSAVRAYSAGALGEIGPRAKAAVPDLTLALGDREALVRLAAAAALGKMGRQAREAAPRLEILISDQDGEVGRAAAEALEKIKG